MHSIIALSPDSSRPNPESSRTNVSSPTHYKYIPQTLEEVVELEIGGENIDKMILDALLDSRPVLFDLSLLNRPRLMEMGINYFDLSPEILDVLERVVRNRLTVVNPSLREAIDSGKAKLNISYINAYRVEKISADIVGRIVSVIGIPREVTEHIIAKEIVYKCRGCNAHRTARPEDPAPRCRTAACERRGEKMEKMDVSKESCEVTFMLRMSNGQVICRGEKNRVCDIQREKWLLMSGIECEINGIVRRDLRNKEVEYWIEVIGSRILHVDEKVNEPIQTLDEVRQCFPQIIGEDESLLLSILAIASRLNMNRAFWIMGIVIQGQSSAGKSYLMRHVVAPWKVMGRVIELSRFTGAFLERMAQILQRSNVDNLVIAIPELFSNSPQQLHVLLSEGKLTLGVVDKETGEPIMYEIEGQPFLIATTTAVEFREDLLNRVLTVKVDETEEQTRKILQNWVALSNNNGEEDCDRGIIRLVNHLRSLRPCRVVIPYADVLLKLFEEMELPVTMRRDFPKMLSIIMASALLFQNNRPKIQSTADGQTITTIIATLEDYENMLRMFNQLNITITRLTYIDKKVLEILRAAEEEEGKEGLTRKEIQKRLAEEKLYYSDTWIGKTLQKLANAGYVEEHSESRPYTYMAIKHPRSVNPETIKPEIEQKVAEYLDRMGLKP